MKNKYGVKVNFKQSVCDILQIPEIPECLDENQVKVLLNLNVLSKWCYKIQDHKQKYSVGEIVKCIPYETFYIDQGEKDGGAGWREDLVFKINDVSFEGKILWGGYDDCGVYANRVIPATQEEIDHYQKQK